MSYITEKDFLIEVAAGKVSGAKLIHGEGYNPTLQNGVYEQVQSTSGYGLSIYLQAATTVRVAAGSAADSAASTGAREVTIEGIDSNGDLLEEAVATAGGSASSSTSASFWRVTRAWVSATGTYGGSNTGAVVVENTAGTQNLIEIDAEQGISRLAGFSIPTGYTGHLLRANLKPTNATFDALVKLWSFQGQGGITDVSAPMAAKRLEMWWQGIVGNTEYKPASPKTFPGLSDFYFEAAGDGQTGAYRIDFELLLLAD